jgi:two-component system, cell cycle sensor histidine kinase and response regulator CckA
MNSTEHIRKSDTELALRNSEARLQALLDSSLDCVIYTNAHSRITEFNKTAERTFRVHRTEVLGKDVIETIFPVRLWERKRCELFGRHCSPGVDLISHRCESWGIRANSVEFPIELTFGHIRINDEIVFTLHIRDISARLAAEEEVERLAAIVESSQDAIVGTDLYGRINSWNKGAERMTGYGVEEAIGKHITFLKSAEARDKFPELVARLRSGSRVTGVETGRITKDGRLIILSVEISIVKGTDGEVIGASIIGRDVTQNRLAEEALRKANETSVYASPVPILGLDTDGLVTMCNPSAESVFGWSEKELTGRPLPTIPKDGIQEAISFHERLVSGETLSGLEVKRVRRDGTLLDISLIAAPLRDADDRVKGYIGFYTDISERKKAEQALRAAEEKYRSIFENAVEGVFQTTTEGRYVSANPAMAKMLGFASPTELIDSWDDISTQQYVQLNVYEEFEHRIRTHGVVQNFEYEAHRKDATRLWISQNAHAVCDNGAVLYFEGTAQDITERREMEQQLRQMQKIEAIGRLAGGVAHDFNNILMAISSYAELLYGTGRDENSKRYAEEIMTATDRGAALTHSLLAFSRKQVLVPAVVNLDLLVAEQLKMLERLVSETIQLRFVPSDQVAYVKADKNQLEQVVMNLVINARDAMPDGGVIILETRVGACDAMVSSSTAAGKACVTLTVTDSGCGIDPETIPRIFEPFFTTKEQGKGTGLGLATVFGIVQQSGGDIMVESQIGQGTTFKVVLPYVENENSVEHELSRIPVALGSETILLVEDENGVRESTAEYLSSRGYSVLKARVPTEALEIAGQHKTPIHLLLTDVVMPQMNGRDLSQKLIMLHPEMKVVFMSGYYERPSEANDSFAQTAIVLRKPFRLTVLGQKLRQVLDGN